DGLRLVVARVPTVQRVRLRHGADRYSGHEVLSLLPELIVPPGGGSVNTAGTTFSSGVRLRMRHPGPHSKPPPAPCWGGRRAGVPHLGSPPPRGLVTWRWGLRGRSPGADPGGRTVTRSLLPGIDGHNPP